jgi:hypothetical protein
MVKLGHFHIQRQFEVYSHLINLQSSLLNQLFGLQFRKEGTFWPILLFHPTELTNQYPVFQNTIHVQVDSELLLSSSQALLASQFHVLAQ